MHIKSVVTRGSVTAARMVCLSVQQLDAFSTPLSARARPRLTEPHLDITVYVSGMLPTRCGNNYGPAYNCAMFSSLLHDHILSHERTTRKTSLYGGWVGGWVGRESLRMRVVLSHSVALDGDHVSVRMRRKQLVRNVTKDSAQAERDQQIARAVGHTMVTRWCWPIRDLCCLTDTNLHEEIFLA